jgi:hypothetical protein
VSQNLSICEGKDFQDLNEALAKEVLSFVELNPVKKKSFSKQQFYPVIFGNSDSNISPRLSSCTIM